MFDSGQAERATGRCTSETTSSWRRNENEKIVKVASASLFGNCNVLLLLSALTFLRVHRVLYYSTFLHFIYYAHAMFFLQETQSGLYKISSGGRFSDTLSGPYRLNLIQSGKVLVFHNHLWWLMLSETDGEEDRKANMKWSQSQRHAEPTNSSYVPISLPPEFCKGNTDTKDKADKQCHSLDWI